MSVHSASNNGAINKISRIQHFFAKVLAGKSCAAAKPLTSLSTLGPDLLSERAGRRSARIPSRLFFCAFNFS